LIHLRYPSSQPLARLGPLSPLRQSSISDLHAATAAQVVTLLG
jgi:hypothetical protein